jgi:large conductance mechanosensitive channel
MVKETIQDFREFLTKANVFGVAVGFLIGTAVAKIAESILNGLFMPIFGIFKETGDWTNITLNIGRVQFQIGLVVSAIVNFLALALIIFIAIRLFAPKPAPAPAGKQCPECRESIHPEARKCRFCGSAQ